MSLAQTRFAAGIFLLGIVVAAVSGIFHPDHQVPNDHTAVFAEYAESSAWTLIHLGQFLGIALIVVGLLSFCWTAGAKDGLAGWASRLGAALAIASLAVYAALQAVDGVALKQAVNAWQAAPEPEKVARFAVAEGIRWLEWGVRSYHSFVFGLALVAIGASVVLGNRLSKVFGYLLAASGVAYLIQGWIVGTEGFSAANSIPTLVSIVAIVLSAIWMLVRSVLMKRAQAGT